MQEVCNMVVNELKKFHFLKKSVAVEAAGQIEATDARFSWICCT